MADDGMAGGFQRLEPLVMRGVVLAFGTDIDEEAVVGVERGIAERFAVDRDQAFAVLAGGFGDQLFCPGAEIGDLWRRAYGHLFAAFEAGETHGKAEQDARVFMRRHIGAAGPHHCQRVCHQAANIDAGGGRGHQPEWRQHRISPADRGIAVEDAGKALFRGVFCSDEPGSVTAMKRCPALPCRSSWRRDRRNNPSSRSARWCRRICWRR